MNDAFAGLQPCVHCGFCLQSCPTFLETGDEADGPRGRIVLMQALARGDLPADDPALMLHLDRCLGCRGCEPVCPSGVRYGPALEAARERIAERRPPAVLSRSILTVMAEPALRGPAIAAARVVRSVAPWLAGRASDRATFALGMLASTRRQPIRRMAYTPPPNVATRGEVVVFDGCIMPGLFAQVQEAARRTLAANGYTVVDGSDRICCGALHAHAGLAGDAARLARANIAAFAEIPDATIAVTSAGCGAMLKAYRELFADDPLAEAAAAFAARVSDVTELLAAAGPRSAGPLPLRVAYDPPCHLAHVQGVVDAPLAVLRAIEHLELVPHDEATLCCGGAGIYGLAQPEFSRAVLARKVDALIAAAPDIVATGNPGCIMQIGAGLKAAGHPIPVVHPVELLDWAYGEAAPGLPR